MKLTNLAIHVNNFRLFPRIALIWYLINCHEALRWYETVLNPSVTQTTFVSLVTAMLPIILKFYLDTGTVADEK